MLKKILTTVFVLLIACQVLAANCSVVKFPANEVSGAGPLPYNYRIIDGYIHAGGHPLNPINHFSNTDQQVLSILNYLKSKNVYTVIDLENTASIQRRYQRLLDKAGLKRIHIPLNNSRVPNREEWARIKEAMQGPVYIHCAWGADRTGMVIARFLVEEKNYTPDEAYHAVISGGTHSGALGGLKQSSDYLSLKNFIYQGADAALLQSPALSEDKPGFSYQPDIFPAYVIDSDQLPVLTFSVDRDVSVEVWEMDETGQHYLSLWPLTMVDLEKGIKLDVAWKTATLPNGNFNFHVVLIDKAGHRADYNIPFTIHIINNPNLNLILY